MGEISGSLGLSGFSGFQDQPSWLSGSGASRPLTTVLNEISGDTQSTYLLRTTGNIGTNINVVIGSEGNLNLTVDELCNKLNDKSSAFINIRSDSLGTPGFLNIHNIPSANVESKA